MAASTEADLRELPKIYQSSRLKWDLLLGEDPAAAVVASIFSDEGETESLRRLLLQPPWTDIALERRHTIYSEHAPRLHDHDVRAVSARPMSHLQRIFYQAVDHNKPEAVAALLKFASETKGVELSSLINNTSVYPPTSRGYTAVIEAMVLFYPKVVNLYLSHGFHALDNAVRVRQAEVAAALLKHGAKPRAYSVQSAAASGSSQLVKLLLQYGTPINGTGALHQAARSGHLDVMQLLLEHGADLDDVLPLDRRRWEGGRIARWTPMHHAASYGQVDAMKLLEINNSRAADMKDTNGKTPTQVLAEHRLGKSLKELLSANTEVSAPSTGCTVSASAVDIDVARE